METVSLTLVYLSIMFYIAPVMSVFAIGLLGGIMLVMRFVIEPVYTASSLAETNEQVSSSRSKQGSKGSAK